MSVAASPLRALVRLEQRRQAGRLALAALSAAIAATAAAALLGLSGWFLTAAAIAGAAGPLVASAFNYLLPAAAIRFLAIARTGARYSERLVGHAAALRALAEIRPALFAGLAASLPAEALELSSGEAASRLVRDVDAIESLFVRQSAPWAAVAAVALAAGLAALVSPWAGLIVVAAFSALIAAGLWIAAGRARAPAAAALRTAGALKAGVQAFVAASAELRCFGFTSAAVDHLMALDARFGSARRREWEAQADMGVLQPALSGLAVAGVLALSAHVSRPLAAAAALAASVALEGAAGLLSAFDRTGAVDAASARLDGMLTQPAQPPAPTGIDGPPSITLRLADQVCDLTPGERLGLTGPSGAGKTRLLETLLRLRDPAPGEIELNGQPLESFSPAVCRAVFSYVPQDARMISGTVRENLELGDAAASDAVMLAALRVAQLSEKVSSMPAGLDAWIGDGGAILSGGERRRLALARALLRPAPWLLLDEPTEGLDAETEIRVITALEQHLTRNSQGLILVSHRPAPLALCRRRACISAA